jgi:hypothetical protein
LTSFVADPVQNRDIADAENACDGAETHVAHGVEKQRQRFHSRRLSARRRHREIATTRTAKIALQVAHNTISYMVGGATPLAANLLHGGSLSVPRQGLATNMVNSILS